MTNETKGHQADFDIDPGLAHWKIQTWNKDTTNPRAFCVPYFDARDIAEKLDDLFGWWGWQDRYASLERGVLCTISVASEAGWVEKSGMADYSDIEPVKGAESDAFKRAAAKLGVGRNAYQMDAVWEKCEVRDGKPLMPRDFKPAGTPKARKPKKTPDVSVRLANKAKAVALELFGDAASEQFAVYRADFPGELTPEITDLLIAAMRHEPV